MNKKIVENNEVQRIPTRICGLDNLLYGGLDIIKRPFTIVIRGGAGSESTLFGLQLLYGIALSLSEKERDTPFTKPVTPYFVTSCHKKIDIDTLMIDTFISSCIYSMTRRIIDKSYCESDLSKLTNTFFETKTIVNYNNWPNGSPKMPIQEIKTMPDQLIAESVMYYNNRTRALHYRTADNIADLSNMVYKRKHQSINEYLTPKDKDEINQFLYGALHTQLLNTEILSLEEMNQIVAPVLIAVEMDNTKEKTFDEMRETITKLKKMADISILIVDEETNIPANDSDILIDLYNKTRNGYVLHYLNMKQNSHQSSVLGEHQYKRRDFGIEVFPSIHTYSKIKKNYHRSLIYTQSNIIDDTFPQYLNRNARHHHDNYSYEDFINNKSKFTDVMMNELHPSNNVKLISYDILKKIFLTGQKEDCKQKDYCYHDEEGLVTAIIGGGNTFKRYLTIGSAFSAAVNNEDTLIVVLNKEKHLIHKRMACPARMRHNCYKPHCADCYRHFHLMNIYPEYITRDEFIYMLHQRIKLAFDKPAGRYIKRIIIDDLQILDYSFPFLKGDGDFLSAIMNICREHDISLYILCDKEAKSRDILKALADNVVCTEKTGDGKPRIYVERCSGYYNPPSKMYCGVIDKIEELFECNEQYCANAENNFHFTISPIQIEDTTIPNIDVFGKK